jgi:hypothetical protein
MPPRMATAFRWRMWPAYLSVAAVTCRASSRVGARTSIFGCAGWKRGRSRPRERADWRSWFGRAARSGRRNERRAFLRRQAVQCRQHEGGGFAGTGLRRNQQVASFDGGGNRLRLDGGRVGVTGLGKGFKQGFVKPDFCKGHQSLSCRTAPRNRGDPMRGRKNATPTNESVERLCLGERIRDISAQQALCQGGVYGSTPGGRGAWEMRRGSRSEKSLQFSAIDSLELHEARILLAGLTRVERFLVVFCDSRSRRAKTPTWRVMAKRPR